MGSHYTESSWNKSSFLISDIKVEGDMERLLMFPTLQEEVVAIIGSYFSDCKDYPKYAPICAEKVIAKTAEIVRADTLKERDNFYKEWLDDIYLCKLYGTKQRDELCRSMWEALKKGGV